jgi:hypothetical protein
MKGRLSKLFDLQIVGDVESHPVSAYFGFGDLPFRRVRDQALQRHLAILGEK